MLTIAENGITEQGRVAGCLRKRCQDLLIVLNLRECHPGKQPVGEEEAGLLHVDSGRWKPLWRLPWAPPCRTAGRMRGNRQAVIGGTLLVGIMNPVVSAEAIGRALLQ